MANRKISEFSSVDPTADIGDMVVPLADTSASGSETNRKISLDDIRIWSGGSAAGHDVVVDALAVKQGAEAARDEAQGYAQTPEDTTVPGGAGYSALHYAAKAGADADRAEAAADLAAQGRINAADYGAATDATWQVNRDALQAANDAAVAQGGGTVVLPGGIYNVKGVFTDSHVRWDLRDALLVHPDGSTLDIIRTRITSTNANLSGTTLTVASPARLERGVMIGVRGAGGISDTQSTTLASAITSSQTTGIELTSPTGFPTSGLMQVGTELISYTGIAAAVLTGVVRGVYGTTPAAANAGDVIGLAMRLVTTVESVTGTTVELDPNRVPALNLTGAPVDVGTINVEISATMFGSRLTGGSSSSLNAVRGTLTRFSRFNLIVDQAEAALFLDTSWDNDYEVRATDCSVPEGLKGSAVWLFRQCHRNHGISRLFGDMWAGVYLDNRTTTASDYDGGCDQNTGIVYIDAKERSPWITNSGLLIVAGNGNKFDLFSKNVRTGLVIEAEAQANTHDGSYPPAKGNRIHVDIRGAYQPWVLLKPGNVISGYYESSQFGVNSGGSLIVDASPAPGEAPIMGTFPDGSQSRPGMRFGTELNTGFYRIANGQWQWVSEAQLVMRLRQAGILMAEGKNIDFGTVTGSRIGSGASVKIGFWGAVPVAQPAAVANATDAATAITQLNELLSRLRSAGLIAT